MEQNKKDTHVKLFIVRYTLPTINGIYFHILYSTST